MWQIKPQDLSLNDREIHVWLININHFQNHLEYLLSSLSAEEKHRSQRYKTTALQNKFIINRGLLRWIIGQYLFINPAEIQLDYNPQGKPFLKGIKQGKHDYLHFNLSHKNEYTIYGISNINIGIDLETINHQVSIENIAQRFFSTDEYQDICNLKETEKSEYFFQLWTAKEAYLKCIGKGLSGGLASINLGKNMVDRQWQIKNNDREQLRSQPWQIHTFEILQNYFFSLAFIMIGEPTIKHYQIEHG